MRYAWVCGLTGMGQVRGAEFSVSSPGGKIGAALTFDESGQKEEPCRWRACDRAPEGQSELCKLNISKRS